MKPDGDELSRLNHNAATVITADDTCQDIVVSLNETFHQTGYF